MSQDASTQSRESSHADIPPSKFSSDGIDISSTPAVVSWSENDGVAIPTHHLSHSTHDHLTLQIHRDPQSKTAFFQLKANVALKARRDRTNVFLSIHPERVKTVALAEPDTSEDTIASKLHTMTYRLQFILNKPPVLVVPKGDLTPKHKASRLVMDSLQALARQVAFSVDLPTSAVSKAKLVLLCESVTLGQLRSTPRFTDLASLYGGKGGEIIEHVSQAATVPKYTPCSAGPEAESPPSYDELGMSSPPRPVASQKPGTKRRRVDTSDTTSEISHQCVSIESVCKMMMERIDNGFNVLGARLDRMEHRLAGLERSLEHNAEKLGLTIEDVQHRSSEQADELRDELDRGLYDVRKEIDDTVTVRVEDEMYVARDQLEDFVKGEIADAEERLEERLEESLNSANVSLDFSWNR